MNTIYDPYYCEILKQELSKRIAHNPQYSLRAFAKSLGMEASALSQIINGKRQISDKVINKLVRGLGLSPNEEKSFITSVAEYKKHLGLTRISPSIKNAIPRKEKGPKKKELSIDIFKVIAEWYHYAILELTFIDEFKSDPRWIASQLGIGISEAKLAVERLLELELLSINQNGKLIKTELHLTTADKHLTSSAHKTRQKQILNKSLSSLENDPISCRNHSGMTLAVSEEKIPEAKKKIEQFLAELTEFLEDGERTRVYELTVNLFPLQKQTTVTNKENV